MPPDAEWEVLDDRWAVTGLAYHSLGTPSRGGASSSWYTGGGAGTLCCGTGPD